MNLITFLETFCLPLSKNKFGLDDTQFSANLDFSREVVRGVAGVAAATPFFEPEKIRNFVISFLRLIDYGKKS